MTAPLDEAVVQHVNDVGTTVWSGRAYRFTTTRRDPLSGEGSYKFGGRWNPRGIFAALYLAVPRSTALLEFQRRAEAASMEPLDMLRAGYTLHAVDVRELPVLDLRDEARLAAVGLGMKTSARTTGPPANPWDMPRGFLNMVASTRRPRRVMGSSSPRSRAASALANCRWRSRCRSMRLRISG